MCPHHNAGQRSWANMHTEHQQISQAVPLLQSNVFCNKKRNDTELWVSTSRGAKIFLKKAKPDFSILCSQSSVFLGSSYTYIYIYICVFFLPFFLSGLLDVTSINPCGAVLLLLAKFVRKSKLKTKNSKKKSDFCRFSVRRSEREKNVKKIRHFSIFGFQLVAKTIEGWWKIYTWFLVDSQIWLNLPREDRHFCYILLWMVATLAFLENPKNDVGSCSPCALIPNSRVSHDVSARTCLVYLSRICLNHCAGFK
jgi:hypothetical protein